MKPAVSKIPVFKKYLARFRPVFTAKMFDVFTDVFDSTFYEYKRCSIQAITDNLDCDYNHAHYFFSRAKWDHKEINDIRLNIIQAQRTTKGTKDAVLAIDDTSVPKPYAKATEGARYQYCGVLGREEVCNVAVFSAICTETKQYPVDYRSYRPASEFEFGKTDPAFRSKIDQADELIADAVNRGIQFEAVTFDSWYTAKRLLESTHEKGLPFVGALKSNRKIITVPPGERQTRGISADDLVTVVREKVPERTKFMSVRLQDGTMVERRYYIFDAKLKDCDLPLRFVIVFGGWSEDRKTKILVTNKLAWSAEKIVTTYQKRWGIELVFRELKDTFGWDQYQMRRIRHIERWWDLVLTAWTAVYWIRQNGYLTRIVDDLPETIGDYKRLCFKLARFSSGRSLSKSSEFHWRQSAATIGLKSERFFLRIPAAD